MKYRDVAVSPIPWVFILLVGIMMTALIAASGEVDLVDFSNSINPDDLDDPSFFDTLILTITVGIQFIKLVLGFLTLDFTGMPWWIRVPTLTVVYGGLVYAVYTMIRGNE